MDDLIVNSNSSTFQPCESNIVACPQMTHENGSPMGDDSGTHQIDQEYHDSLDGGQNGIYSNTETARIAEDGYNWRKYGQKQVKGSEYPRSYYKCTHPNCPVRKKVERSLDGHITEIIYKNAHSHPKPQQCRKLTSGLLPFNETSSELGDGNGNGSCMKVNGVWRSTQSGYNNGVVSDWGKTDGLVEMTSSTSALTEISDLLSTNQGKPMGVFESAGTPEFSSTPATHEDDEEDAATQGGGFLIGHDSEIEPDLKRRYKVCRFGLEIQPPDNNCMLSLFLHWILSGRKTDVLPRQV